MKAILITILLVTQAKATTDEKPRFDFIKQVIDFIADCSTAKAKDVEINYTQPAPLDVIRALAKRNVRNQLGFLNEIEYTDALTKEGLLFFFPEPAESNCHNRAQEIRDTARVVGYEGLVTEGKKPGRRATNHIIRKVYGADVLHITVRETL